jgi:hypothetical protein
MSLTAHPLVAPITCNGPQNSAFERENLKNSGSYAEQFG